MEVAILDRYAVKSSVVQLLALLQNPWAVVGMQMFHPELQCPAKMLPWLSVSSSI